MEAFIKYKRIKETVDKTELLELFDKLIAEGWEIINYSESQESKNSVKFTVIIIVGKKQNKLL